jgi:hypothetical protein
MPNKVKVTADNFTFTPTEPERSRFRFDLLTALGLATTLACVAIVCAALAVSLWLAIRPGEKVESGAAFVSVGTKPQPLAAKGE